MNDDSLVSGDVDTWPAEMAIVRDSLIATAAEVARRHRVMVVITISPYDADVDEA